MRCPECGSEVIESAIMCPACGAPLSNLTKAKVNESGKSFFNKHLELVLLVIGILVIALGALILLPNSRSVALIAKDQTFDHANPFVTLILLVISSILIVAIVTAQAGRLPFIRRIPGLNAIDEAVGRATEMGRPILFSPGLRGLDIITLQALSVASYVGKTAVRYGTRLIIPVCDSQIMPITEQMMREVYASEGKPEEYREDDIRYLSDRQFAYAAGVTGILHRERVAASFLFGMFFAESLILAENGQAVGAIQIAGTPDLMQIPFFVVTCDYTIIGDEYYAASAYLSRDPTQLGSLVGQDISKTVILALVIAGMVLSCISQHHNILLQWLGGK